MRGPRGTTTRGTWAVTPKTLRAMGGPGRRNVIRAGISAALVSGLLAVGCGTDPADSGAVELEEREAEFVAAMAAGDADRIAGLFTVDGVVHVANMDPVEGRDAIRAFYANLFGFLIESSATPHATERSQGGDMAYSFGATSNAFLGPDGPVRYSGKYLLVWTRERDEWMVRAYSISSDGSEGDG